MRIKVTGQSWRIRLLTPEQFIKEHGVENDDANAITDVVKMIVDFREDRKDEIDVYVRHETYHMFHKSLLLDDVVLDMDEMEEMSANLMGHHGEEFIKVSRKISKWLKKQLQYNTR